MRYIFLGIAILLTACASTMPPHYTQTQSSWRGGNAGNLVKLWGTPYMRLPAPNGNTAYVYRTQTHRNYNQQTAPAVGVHFTASGKPVILTTPNTNFWDRNASLAVSCTTVVIVNPKGQIVDTTRSGGCYR